MREVLSFELEIQLSYEDVPYRLQVSKLNNLFWEKGVYLYQNIKSIKHFVIVCSRQS